MLYQCPCNADIVSEQLRSTDYLCSQAVPGSAELPCLWLRGLLPNSIILINTPFPSSPSWQFVGKQPPGDVWDTGLYYSDASGGKYSSIPLLRRCGLGIVRLTDGCPTDGPFDDLAYILEWGVFGVLPGRAQTIPRAELFCVVESCRL